MKFFELLQSISALLFGRRDSQRQSNHFLLKESNGAWEEAPTEQKCANAQEHRKSGTFEK